ncbi:MAG: DUF4293 domain-containing protein [Flavobacteriales bacterium]|nr:DUF4293 domain-containing protein [Flavobacteriales bacterium]MDW8431722.1 DUF4293 family protein [Flavobacteriales bacterium]
MIQRVQTFYLLVAAGIGIFQLFIPFVKFRMPDDGICQVTGLSTFSAGMWHVGILLLALIGTSLWAVFQFRRRPRQLKITHFAALCALAATLAALVAVYAAPPDVCSGGTVDIGGSGGLLMMPLAIFALLLASRGIRRDEALVRSADRIR